MYQLGSTAPAGPGFDIVNGDIGDIRQQHFAMGDILTHQEKQHFVARHFVVVPLIYRKFRTFSG
jgi:hypothetical protein